MEFFSAISRFVRAHAQRQMGSAVTSSITPPASRLELLSRRKDEIEKSINRNVFLLAAGFFLSCVLMIVLPFMPRASPLTVLAIRLIICGCSVLSVGLIGVLLILNYQIEFLSRDITNVRFWSEINQSANRSQLLERERGNYPRNITQFHQNIRSSLRSVQYYQNEPVRNLDNVPNFRNIQNAQTFPSVPNVSNSQNVTNTQTNSKSSNVSNDSNLRNDVMNIFRIRTLLPYIPFIPKDKRWSISPECDNCGTLMKQLTRQCISYIRDIDEDQSSCKNILKRKINMIRGIRDTFVKYDSIWSEEKETTLNVSSSDELGVHRVDQSAKICQIPTSRELRQDILSEHVFNKGEEIYPRDHQQSSLTDNFRPVEESNLVLDQSVRSKHLASSTSLQSKEDYENNLLNITKNIWNRSYIAPYESSDSLSETERNIDSEFKRLGTNRLVDEMLKNVSPDFQLSSTVSESSNFLNINSESDVPGMKLNMCNKDRSLLSGTSSNASNIESENLNSGASNASNVQPLTRSIYKSRRKNKFKRKATSLNTFADNIRCGTTSAEIQTNVGQSQLPESNVPGRHCMNTTDRPDDISGRKTPIVCRPSQNSVASSQLFETNDAGMICMNPESSDDFSKDITTAVVY